MRGDRRAVNGEGIPGFLEEVYALLAKRVKVEG